ncbi:MAG: phosphatase PAP2 family protein [Polyangiales bacterium]
MVVLLAQAPSLGHAQVTEPANPSVPSEQAQKLAPLVEAPPRWQPQFQPVQPFEYVLTTALGVGTLAIALFAEPRHGSYGGVLFDGAVRDALLIHDPSAATTVRTIGDLGYFGMMALPFVDVGLTWALHGDSRLAWQMFAIDAGALAWAGFSAVAVEYLVGRMRPNAPVCEDGQRCGGPGTYKSFFSGHVAMATAGAAVTCAHHLNVDLYGAVADPIVCATSAAIALTTGFARIATDKHWTSDVLVGWIVGSLAGYVWPRLFHYRTAPAADGVKLAIMPLIAPHEAQALVIGRY